MPTVTVPSVLIVRAGVRIVYNWPLSSLFRYCCCIAPDVGPLCGGSLSGCSIGVSMEVPGIVCGIGSVRVFDERRFVWNVAPGFEYVKVLPPVFEPAKVVSFRLE